MFVLESLLSPEDIRKFDIILAGDDVPMRKPHPMIYEQAAKKIHVRPERYVKL
jgi:HAD superfamily hydrolase (TIGR01509 family)